MSANQDLDRSLAPREPHSGGLQDRALLNDLPVCLKEVGFDGTILWANQAELAFYGLSLEQYSGRNVADFAAAPSAAANLQATLSQRQPFSSLRLFVHDQRDRVRPVSLTGKLRFDGGQPVSYWCTQQDSLNQAVLDLQARLAAVVESSDDAIVSIDLSGMVQSWNRGAERLFGYPAEEIIGRPISLLAPADVAQEVPGILARIAGGERLENYETCRCGKDGRAIDVSLTISPILNSRDECIGISEIARDITERQRASESQARLAAIVESSDDAIISKDLNGIIRSWNIGAERILGYRAEEVLGRHISVIAAPETVGEFPTILSRIAKGERVEHYQTRRRTKDGRILTVSLTVSPVRDDKGRIIGASKILRDMTQREKQEQELREANEALQRSNSDLEQFAYSASHDLQEPLRIVASYTGMLKRRFGGQLGPEADEYIQHTLNGVQRMHQLLKDLLFYAHAAQPLDGEEVLTDADAALHDAIANLKAAIEESGAVIQASALPKVRIRHVHLEQVFQNLISNAIRYRGVDPPQIAISTLPQGADWLFCVRDNGIGIDPKYQEEIFGIFKRLHSSAEYPGTGMGLAICQRLVQQAKGRIWVESESGKGATFCFTLPRAE